MIQCRSCQRLKEVDDFYLRGDGINRFNTCKSCIAKETAEQKRKVKERIELKSS